MIKKMSFKKKFFRLKNILPLCLILLALFPATSFAQNQVSGVVKDNSGNPLENVSVMVQGTSKGTTTDATGKFSISVSSNAKLVFSFTGYETKEMPVNNQSDVTVILKPKDNSLESVVVIGYGTQKKKDLTSAISSVSAEDLKDKPLPNFADAMSGKMAGVKIANTNTAPGGGTKIVIRGVSSINASNDPLIVIDGFPLKDGFDKTENPLNSINVADIESIEVLKDATSSAIYGTQAANGVILITTKKGKKGKPTFNINVSSGFQQMINKVDVLNRDDFLKYIDDARANAYIVEDPNFGTNNPNLPQWKWTDSPETRIANWEKYSSNAAAMKSPGSLFYRWITVSDTIYKMPYNTDWQDVITRVGKVNDVQLSASGGGDNFTYRISGGYFNQEGIVKTSGYNRFSFRANLDLKVNNYLKLGLLLAPSLENIQKIPIIEGGGSTNPFYNAIAMPPIWNPTDANGNPVFYGNTLLDAWDWNFAFFVNPLHSFLRKSSGRKFRNLSTLYAEINILKNLKFRSEFHTEYSYGEDNDFTPNAMPTTSQTFSRSHGVNQTNNLLYWNSQNFLTYQAAFGRHSLTAMAGYSVEESSFRSAYISKYDYPTDLIPTLNQAITIQDAQNDARTNRSSEALIGSFGRFMYNYAGKYYLTGSIRRDGSSKFGKDNKWGVFPSLSTAWRVSDESFFKPLKPYISDWKIRGGWGRIGNAGIGNYLALSTLSSSSYVLGAGSAVSPAYSEQKISNPALGWEATTDWGIGTDVGLLGRRVKFTVDYFYRVTENMLFSMPLPTITGFSSYTANIGSMRNRGFEYAITTRNLVGAFNWTTNLNLSYYRNRVLDIGKDKRPLINNDGYTTEGKPLAGIWGGSFLGPYRDWEDVKTSPIVNAQNAKWRFRSAPGTPKLADVNGDGIIDGSDNTIIGSAIPDFVWGMSNNFEYKTFDLSIQINGTQGGDVSMRGDEGIYGRGDGRTNTTVDYFQNYWRPDRPDAKYTAPTRKSYDGTNTSGTLLYKGTFVNVQNVVLGYTLPERIQKNMKVSNLRIYVSIQNALYFTNFPGYNPEANYQGDSSLSQGINRDSYPMSRTVSFGFNLSL